MQCEPKRCYSKDGNDISNFWLLIKRSDRTKSYDSLKFEAYGTIAKYINDYLHKGDLVSVRSRPVTKKYKHGKTGETRFGVVFRVSTIEFICHRNRLMLNQFGESEFPELDERQFQFWG